MEKIRASQDNAEPFLGQNYDRAYEIERVGDQVSGLVADSGDGPPTVGDWLNAEGIAPGRTPQHGSGPAGSRSRYFATRS